MNFKRFYLPLMALALAVACSKVEIEEAGDDEKVKETEVAVDHRRLGVRQGGDRPLPHSSRRAVRAVRRGTDALYPAHGRHDAGLSRQAPLRGVRRDAGSADKVL